MSSTTQNRKNIALVPEGPEGLFTLKELPTPTPKKGEVLVKVQSCGLNPADWKIPKYRNILTEKFPDVLGFDIAGEVVEVGENVANYGAGDRVFFQLQSHTEGGGLQQYSIALASLVSKDRKPVIRRGINSSRIDRHGILWAVCGIPQGLGLVPPVTDEGYGKYKDTPIFITGGASTVGQGAIQFAKFFGFSPIITTASLKNEEALKKAGAAHVVDRSLSNEDIIAAIAKITAGKQVQYVYDSVGSDATQKLSVDLLSRSGPGGTVAFALPWLTVAEADYPSVKIAKIAASPHVTPPTKFRIIQILVYLEQA